MAVQRRVQTDRADGCGRQAGGRVWRIARFEERFEMAEYRRKGGLDWVRMFVTSSTNQQSNESTQFLQQLDELDHYYPAERDAYEGRFWRICRLTSTQEDWLRGYLLDADRRPLGDARLAARLHLETRAMKATLAALRRVGLLETVPCPDFSRPPERTEDCADEPQESGSTRGAARGRPAKKGRKTGAAASIREDSELFRNSPEPLYELTIDKSKSRSNGQMAKGQSQANAKAQGQAQTQDQNQDQDQAKAKGPGPIQPQDVTAQGGRHPQPHAEGQPAITPPARVSEPRIVPLHPDGVSLGSLLPRAMSGLAHGYVVRADEFADEIFALLRAPFTRESREGCRERGNYRAGLLDAIDAGLSPGQIEELMACARHDAAEIAKHRKRHYRNGGSPETYWRFLFNKHMYARCGLPPVRAGPEAATG